MPCEFVCYSINDFNTNQLFYSAPSFFYSTIINSQWSIAVNSIWSLLRLFCLFIFIYQNRFEKINGSVRWRSDNEIEYERTVSVFRKSAYYNNDIWVCYSTSDMMCVACNTRALPYCSHFISTANIKLIYFQRGHNLWILVGWHFSTVPGETLD